MNLEGLEFMQRRQSHAPNAAQDSQQTRLNQNPNKSVENWYLTRKSRAEEVHGSSPGLVILSSLD